MIGAFALLPVFATLVQPLVGQPGLNQQKATGDGFEYRLHDTDKISPAEFKARRMKFRESLKPGAAALLVTNPLHQRSNDTDFPFRPNSYFWYLTGCEEQDSALLVLKDPVLVNGDLTDEILFVKEKNPSGETWTGILMGVEKAKEILKVQSVQPLKKFSDVLSKISPTAFTLVEQPDGLSGSVKGFIDFVNTNWGKLPKDSAPISALNVARSIKSPAEIDLTWKSIKATVAAHKEALKSCQPGMREFEIKSLVEYIFGKNGCESVAYGSIVGSGVHSCVLHYVDSRKLIEKNDMLCMDVGGEYHGYASDVTRSYPADGKFSPAQREIYEIVREAQEAGVQACKPGAKFNVTGQIAQQVISKGLMKLGIIKSASETGRYFMHGTTHYVGLDVHDTGDYGPLRENQIITVEPGIYIKEGSPCDPKYWNIGVRIEDTVLITANGVINMSGSMLPRSISEIEGLMAQKGLGNFVSRIESLSEQKSVHHFSH